MKKICSFIPGHDVLAHHDASHEGLARQHGFLAGKVDALLSISVTVLCQFIVIFMIWCDFYCETFKIALFSLH